MTQEEIRKSIGKKLIENNLPNDVHFRKAFVLGMDSKQEDLKLTDIKSNLFCFCQERVTISELIGHVIKETEDELSEYVNEWMDSSSEQMRSSIMSLKKELIQKYTRPTKTK